MARGPSIPTACSHGFKVPDVKVRVSSSRVVAFLDLKATFQRSEPQSVADWEFSNLLHGRHKRHYLFCKCIIIINIIIIIISSSICICIIGLYHYNLPLCSSTADPAHRESGVVGGAVSSYDYDYMFILLSLLLLVVVVVVAWWLSILPRIMIWWRHNSDPS